MLMSSRSRISRVVALLSDRVKKSTTYMAREGGKEGRREGGQGGRAGRRGDGEGERQAGWAGGQGGQPG